MQKEYKNLSEQLISEESQAIDKNKLYYQVVGGHNKKNTVYGLGSAQNLFYGPEMSSDPDSHITSSQCTIEEEYHKLQAEMEEMKNSMKEADEMRTKEVDEMKEKMRQAEEMRMKEVDAVKDQMKQMQNQLVMIINSRN